MTERMSIKQRVTAELAVMHPEDRKLVENTAENAVGRWGIAGPKYLRTAARLASIVRAPGLRAPLLTKREQAQYAALVKVQGDEAADVWKAQTLAANTARAAT